MTREIPLTRGLVALVDDDDYEIITSGPKWQAIPADNKARQTFYARRCLIAGGGRRTESMHRLIMCATENVDVDHVNHDGLDNRRANLRFCDRARNCANAFYRPRTGFRGVYFRNVGLCYPATSDEARKGFYAAIRVNGALKKLGTFSDPEDAARAYDAAAIDAWGEFATLNFPPLAQKKIAAMEAYLKHRPEAGDCAMNDPIIEDDE